MKINAHQTGYAHQQGANKQTAKPQNAAVAVVQQDTLEISNEAKTAQQLPHGTSFIGTQGHTINRLHMQVVNIEHAGEQWTALVTPDAIWIAPEGHQSPQDFVLLDPGQPVAGIPQSTVRELEHIGMMVSHMPPGFGNLRISPDHPQGQVPSFEENLRNLTNAFANVRAEFGNSNQHMQATGAAFTTIFNNTFILTGQLARINNGGNGNTGASTPEERRTPEERSQIINQMRQDAQQQLNIFMETFLNNFNQHGADAAFNTAWATLGI